MRGQPFDAFDENPAVPATIVDGDAPPTRQVPPEAPKVVVRPLLVRHAAPVERGHGDHPVLLGVERTGQASDGAAFACGVGTLEQDDRAPAALGQRVG